MTHCFITALGLVCFLASHDAWSIIGCFFTCANSCLNHCCFADEKEMSFLIREKERERSGPSLKFRQCQVFREKETFFTRNWLKAG